MNDKTRHVADEARPVGGATHPASGDTRHVGGEARAVSGDTICRMADDTGRESGTAGDLLVRVGAVLFIVGALATLATVTPLFIGARPLPTAAYLVSMLMGAGFALALAGLLRSALAQRRQVLRSVRASSQATSLECPPDGVARRP